MAKAKSGQRKLNLIATLDGENACSDDKFVIIAVLTYYDHNMNFFGISAVGNVIELVLKSSDIAMMVVKSIFLFANTYLALRKSKLIEAH